MVLNVDGGDDVHACLFANCGWHELEAGNFYHLVRKSHRAGADASECARRRKVRDSLSSVCAGQLRYTRCQSSRDAACDCGVRMVWHSILGGGPGNCCDDRCFVASNDTYAVCTMAQFPRILAAEYVCC